MKYMVFYQDDCNGFDYYYNEDGHEVPAEFDTLEEAIDFCKNEVREYEPYDGYMDSHDHYFYLEVYEGGPIDVDYDALESLDEAAVDKIMKDADLKNPVWTTDWYWRD